MSIFKSNTSTSSTTFKILKYSRARPDSCNPGGISQSQSQSRPPSSSQLPSSQSDCSNLQWSHFSQPTLICKVEQSFGSTQTAEKAAESLWVTIQWRLENNGSSQNQNDSKNNEFMTLVSENLFPTEIAMIDPSSL